jgi:lysophospholipase L1-like esterase
MSKIRVARARALALGLVASVAVIEIGLRVFSLAPSSGIFTVNEAEFARVPGLFSPGQDLVDRQIPVLPYAVRIDSLGYRGTDFPRAKGTGELRVLAIGDSFTFGNFVDDDQTMVAHIERELSRHCARPVTVINAGVGGTTITTHVEMVRRAWALAPDVVLLTFSENDIDDLGTNMWESIARNRRAKSRFPLSVLYPVLRNSAIWHFALAMRGGVRARGDAAPSADSLTLDGPEVQARRAEYARLLGELADEVRSHGARLVFVSAPSHLTVSRGHREEQAQWVDGMAKALGIETVDLLAPFRSSPLGIEGLYLLPHDGHASPRGNALAGTVVAAQLVEGGACNGGQRIAGSAADAANME